MQLLPKSRIAMQEAGHTISAQCTRGHSLSQRFLSAMIKNKPILLVGMITPLSIVAWRAPRFPRWNELDVIPSFC